MLSKLRHGLDIKTLRSVYYAIFESHLFYASLVWAQNSNSVKRRPLLQKKSIRTMFFQSRNSHTGPLFKVSKSFDETALENFIFISKSLKGLLPSIFNSLDGLILVIFLLLYQNLCQIFNVCKCNICLKSFTKLPSKCYIS